MNPLKPSALAAVEDWKAFEPDVKGYIPPQELQLWPGCISIEDQLRKFTSADFMRGNDAPIIAAAASIAFPLTKLVIEEETFSLPLSPRDVAFLSGRSIAGRISVPAAQVSLSNNRATQIISDRVSDGVRNIKALGQHQEILESLDIFKPGSHQLKTVAQDKLHFANVFVILPTFTDAIDICAFATHESAVSQVQLSKDLSTRVSAIAVYTGVSDLRLEVSAGEAVCLVYSVFAPSETPPSLIPSLYNLSGSLPPLRDAFCLWKHKLLSGQDAPPLTIFFLVHYPKHAQKFKNKDATLLCHIAPLAKAYGFNLHVARLNLTRSTRQEVQHEYKDYLGLDSEYDGEDLTMSKHAKERYSVGELTDLGEERLKNDVLLKLAIEQVKGDAYFRKQIRRLRYIERHEIEDDGCYFATVNYEHIYAVQVLLLVPT